MKLIGITGVKRSGKDSLATIIQDYSSEDYKRISFADPMRQIMYDITNYGYDEEIQGPFDYEKHKEAECLILDTSNPFFAPMLVKVLSYGVSNPGEVAENGHKFMKFIKQFEERYFSPREFLQKLGTEFGREQIGDNVWIDTLLHSLEKDGSYIIPDVRFDNEAKAIKRYGGEIIKTVRITDNPIDDVMYEQAVSMTAHKSEAGIDTKYVDHTIVAQDLSQLKRLWIQYRSEHSLSCVACEECSGGDENLQEFNDPIKV